MLCLRFRELFVFFLRHRLTFLGLFDAPSLFGRDLEVFEKVVGAWLDSQPNSYEKVRFSKT